MGEPTDARGDWIATDTCSSFALVSTTKDIKQHELFRTKDESNTIFLLPENSSCFIVPFSDS